MPCTVLYIYTVWQYSSISDSYSALSQHRYVPHTYIHGDYLKNNLNSTAFLRYTLTTWLMYHVSQWMEEGYTVCRLDVCQRGTPTWSINSTVVLWHMTVSLHLRHANCWYTVSTIIHTFLWNYYPWLASGYTKEDDTTTPFGKYRVRDIMPWCIYDGIRVCVWRKAMWRQSVCYMLKAAQYLTFAQAT